MLRRAVPDRSLGYLARIRFDPGDEVFQIFRRHRVLADDQHRIGRQQHHRFKVRHHVVRQRQHGRVEHEVLGVAEDDGVAVGRGAGDPADADAAAGAAQVLDDDRLAETRAHVLGNKPRQRIGHAAWADKAPPW